ncbi:MAG TPA: glycosyltransferase [Mycobacteriales bacterium]|nr:glycosyltransferase [Mycobacteriales bacterium]
MRVLVLTVVHRPDDARIRHREITALLEAGLQVELAAPFSGWGVDPPHDVPGLRCLDLPRAHGRHRVAAARAARRLLRSTDADVVLIHDPELVPWAARVKGRAVVWDVHEDTAAALSMKAWLPLPLRRPTAAAVRLLERWAERRVHLLLAEDGYAQRFAQPHPVVPNSTPVPPAVPLPDRPVAVYVGHVTLARGAAELAEAARLLRGSGIALDVVGHADAPARALLEQAQGRGDLTWHGFLPNSGALAVVEGATAGLSLLHDEPNYRHSRPTKVLEYMARGVPVVTTPTPPARALVERHGCGVVVPFGDAEAAAAAVLGLHEDRATRHRLGAAGHAAALAEHDWNADGPRFVEAVRGWAGAVRT